ncbi:MAG: DUF4321 domain-containing protein [Armatimonadetes bacterium]|nr:DUF4321 domain-containing protein [Armatimonadota bacterium]
MAKPYKQSQNAWVLLLLLFAGGLAGNAVAYVLPPGLGILKAIYTIGLKPATLDLHFLQFTFGLTVDVGILTVLGFLLGYLLYRKV